jgi:hypothetical protein
MSKLKRRPLKMEKEVFEYPIGGNIYTQSKMKLGQVKQLNEMFGTLVLPTNFNAVSMFTVFGSRLAEFMSIVLCKKGTKLQDKDREELVKEFEEEGDVDTGMQVINDFLDCNPIASYFEKITEVFKKFSQANQPR